LEFGDPQNPSAGYFKKEAIAWSWELLNIKYGIPADRIYATVFEGDKEHGIPMDQEAFNEWKKYLPESQILLGSKKDNFWEMGDTESVDHVLRYTWIAGQMTSALWLKVQPW
jgi:alanyl-tRNA synthetase